MSLTICSIASGSNGNCYYVGNATEAILVDAGINCREIELRMQRAGLTFSKIKGVFVSHEHTDHIAGLAVLAKKYKLPVYISTPTLRNCKIKFEKTLLQHFVGNEEVLIGGLTVKPFSKLHDAADPYSFTITGNNVTVGVITDVGAVCKNVAQHFNRCHAVFLEANYDETLLQNGNYPYFLKNRIRNGFGHLSNTQALALFQNHRSPFLSHVFLSHLSQNNNCPRLVEELFTANRGNVEMVVTSRYKESQVYTIYGEHKHELLKPKPSVQQAQLAFAF